MKLRSFFASAVLATFVLCASRDARADEPEKSYGEQIALVDAIGAGTTIGSLLLEHGDSSPVYFAGVGAYAVLSPVVHLVHDHPGRAAGSLAMRVLGIPAAVLLGAGIGVAASQGCKADYCTLGGFVIGGGIGLVGGITTVSLVDALVLAKGETPKTAKPTTGVTFAPSIGFDQHGASAALGGTF